MRERNRNVAAEGEYVFNFTVKSCKTGIEVKMSRETALLIADALEIVNPEDADAEMAARQLANEIKVKSQ